MWDVFFEITCFFGVFVGKPVLIWVVSAVFGVLFLAVLLAKHRYSLLRGLPLLFVSLMWLAYGFYERSLLVLENRGGTLVYVPKYDIRVDLLIISPVLFFATAIAIALSARSVLRAIKGNPGA